jgi:hypothetical protein
MTPGLVPRVDIRSLGVQGELGSGGQGRVLAVDSFRINGQWPTALKTYAHDIIANLDSTALEAIVGFGIQLSPTDRAWLDQNTAWPSVVVEDKGAVCGFLMRRLPQAFYFSFQTRMQGIRQKPADIAFLLNSDRYIRSSGLSMSDDQRLALLEDVAATLSRLHAMDVTVGDMSPKNILFSLSPAPSCFIIDCDAMRVQGRSALPQVHTEDWKLPDGEPSATPAADAYKFGLLAIRLFARDQVSTDRTAITALSPELGRLATDSLHLDPYRRPTPAQWNPVLAAARTTLQSAPASTFKRPGPSNISVPASPVSRNAPQHTPRRSYPASRPPAPAPSRQPKHHAVRRFFGVLLAVAAAAIIIMVGLHVTSSPVSSAAPEGSTGGSTTAEQTERDEANQVNSLLDSSSASRHALVRQPPFGL